MLSRASAPTRETVGFLRACFLPTPAILDNVDGIRHEKSRVTQKKRALEQKKRREGTPCH